MLTGSARQMFLPTMNMCVHAYVQVHIHGHVHAVHIFSPRKLGSHYSPIKP